MTSRASNQPKVGDRFTDGGVSGTVVRCHECGGSGLLHQPDSARPFDRIEPAVPERTATLTEAAEFIAADLPEFDGVRMALFGEDQDTLFAFTDDWQAADDRLPALLAHMGVDAADAPKVGPQSTRWVRIRFRPHADKTSDEPWWWVQYSVRADSGSLRPVQADDEGSFRCVWSER